MGYEKNKKISLDFKIIIGSLVMVIALFAMAFFCFPKNENLLNNDIETVKASSGYTKTKVMNSGTFDLSGSVIYQVLSDLTIDNYRIYLYGSEPIVIYIASGCTLTVPNGIRLEEGETLIILGEGTLNTYGESAGNGAAAGAGGSGYINEGGNMAGGDGGYGGRGGKGASAGIGGGGGAGGCCTDTSEYKSMGTGKLGNDGLNGSRGGNGTLYSETYKYYSGRYRDYATDGRLSQINYSITLDNQSATSAGSTSASVYFNKTIPSITPPTRTGYTYQGYYTGTNGGGTKYSGKLDCK